MNLQAITDAQGDFEKPMHVYQIFLDGIDKTGKDLIRSYIFYLAKGRYICVARGIASMRVYAKLYDRPYQYDDECQKYTVNVLLEVDKDDWEIRCKSSGETLTNYEAERKLFRQEFDTLAEHGCRVLRFNTSKLTPYSIAKLIVKYMESAND